MTVNLNKMPPLFEADVPLTLNGKPTALAVG